MKLGVNIDHIATLRQVRGTDYPSPVIAAILAEKAGADSIVAHLREDRRHIQDKDIFLINSLLKIDFNLEMSLSREIVEIALELKPDKVTLVPEKRKELTTEGGLDLQKNYKTLEKVFPQFKRHNIEVSLFIDPDKKQVLIAKKLGIKLLEFHTGNYAESFSSVSCRQKELTRIKQAVSFACSLGIKSAAGHGLDFKNVLLISKIKGLEELNIGHSIVSEAAFIGLYNAVSKMKRILT